MSPRTHLQLRIGALVLLASIAIWPRARGGATAEELARSAQDVARTRSSAAHAETVAAKLASAPHTKLVVASADDTQLSE